MGPSTWPEAGAVWRHACRRGGSGQAEQVQENLMAAGVQGKFDLFDSGFSQFVTGPELARFLED